MGPGVLLPSVMSLSSRQGCAKNVGKGGQKISLVNML